MPKIVKQLTVGQVKSAKPADKVYKLSDGKGLALWVLPSGSKSWRYTYRRPSDGKQDTITLGLYPDFSLSDAREWHAELHAKVARGINPKTKENSNSHFIFERRLLEWFEHWKQQTGRKGLGRKERGVINVWKRLETYVLPYLRERDVREIETSDVVQVLRRIESKGIISILNCCRSYLNLFFNYLVADGTLKHNPVQVIGQGIFKTRPTTHFKSIGIDELPSLIQQLEEANLAHSIRLAVYWQMLSMVRPNEAIETQIAEIDLSTGLWSIPLERMKTRAHVVPLSAALRQIYHEAMNLSANDTFLFASRVGTNSIRRTSISSALHKQGITCTTLHGLRSLARTYLREKHQIPHDVGEMLLSHSVGNATEQAYNRSELLSERLHYLNLWGNDVMALREKFKK